ncbi:MAG: hypothetical protein GWN33_03935, partial [Gammaproteobacteria bacterium]|nr:hypothetical protein [Gammaproteobacteria bacterium]
MPSAVVSFEIRDVFDNQVTTFTGTASLSSDSPSMFFDTSAAGPFDGSITSVSITGGAGSFFFQDTTAGSPTIAVASGTLTTANQTQTITSASANQLVFTSAAKTVIAGQPSTVVNFEVQDASNNLVPTFNGTVDLSSLSPTMRFDSSAVGPFDGTITTASITSGTGTFFFRDTTTGIQDVTISATGLNSATQNQTITPDTETQLVITSVAQTVVAGQASGAVTFEIWDQFGNQNTAFTGTANLSSDSATTVFDTSPTGPFSGSIGSVGIIGGAGVF